MIDGFDLVGINKASAKFDIEKLRWVNQQHLLNTDDNELKMMLEARSDNAKGLNDEITTSFINAYKNRANTINDLVSSCDNLFSDEIKYDRSFSKKVSKTRSPLTSGRCC